MLKLFLSEYNLYNLRNATKVPGPYLFKTES